VTSPTGKIWVSVAPLPRWLELPRLLGHTVFDTVPLAEGVVRVELALAPAEAAQLAARLRGLGFDGRPLEVEARPGLSRALVRAGRLAEARARRGASPGFCLPGARASGEGRYSLTPEALALALGRQAARRDVVEAFAGSGGNTVGFARAGCRVRACELDPQRLEEAQHNLRLYGVAERAHLCLGDALDWVPRQRGELLFLDPPWGEHYDKRATERASLPLLDALLARDLSGFGEIWIKVPPSFRVASVPGAQPSAWFGVGEGDRQRVKFLLLRCVRT
jgi:hypothetical protein